MTVAVSLLLTAAVVGWIAPRGIGKLDTRRHDPLVLLACWAASVATTITTAAACVALALIPDHGLNQSLLSVLHGCWSSVQHGSPPKVEEGAGALGLAFLVALAIRIGLVGARAGAQRRRVREEHIELLRMAARRDGTAPVILWLSHDRPLAFSLAGRHRVVVATEGLARHLDHREVSAVLEHERAHLRGRHHLLVAGAEVLAAAIPCVPLFRQARRAVPELVELAADVAAVRRCGAAVVRSALVAVVAHGAPENSLAMARDAVEVRLARLARVGPPVGRLRRMLACGLAGSATALLPLLLATGVFVLIAAWACG